MAARYSILVLASFAMLGAAAACGGDDGDGDGDGSGGDVSTGLPKGDKLSELSDDDAIQACTATAKAFNNLLPKAELEKVTCTFAALSAVIDAAEGELGAAAVSQCKQISSDCEAGKGDITNDTTSLGVADEADCKDADEDNPFAECDATVADYENCAGRITTELRTRVRSVSCEDLSDLEELDQTLNGEIDLSKAAE
ncbi:MAG TPA: hypothetical protein VJR89_24910, partial [Polyangiales bacterium]|nr:hypothetical protein [Polyangiales bacterium]